MPVFKINLRRRSTIEPDDIGIECRDFHHAYMEACKAIPETARDVLIDGQDPMACAYIICDDKGQRLMEVEFAEILSPSEWRVRRALRGPHTGVRSEHMRDDLALDSFRRMFSGLNVGCVLMTPELQVVEMNDYGARHSHVDAEEIRGTSILDIFTDLKGVPKDNFVKFMRLAQAGAVSEVIDLPYYVLDALGQTAIGWWNARTWPIFDDTDNMIGLVEWAEPFTRPTSAGDTIVRITPGSAA